MVWYLSAGLIPCHVPNEVSIPGAFSDLCLLVCFRKISSLSASQRFMHITWESTIGHGPWCNPALAGSGWVGEARGARHSWSVSLCLTFWRSIRSIRIGSFQSFSKWSFSRDYWSFVRSWLLVKSAVIYCLISGIKPSWESSKTSFQSCSKI